MEWRESCSFSKETPLEGGIRDFLTHTLTVQCLIIHKHTVHDETEFDLHLFISSGINGHELEYFVGYSINYVTFEANGRTAVHNGFGTYL